MQAAIAHADGAAGAPTPINIRYPAALGGVALTYFAAVLGIKADPAGQKSQS